MALVFANRVQETTATTGTGTITLAGAVSGYQSFAAIGNANTTYYTITSGTAWEVGIGTYTSAGTTLSRDTVLSSSAGGTTKITLAGTSTVFADYPADRAVAYDAANSLTLNGTAISAPAWTTSGVGIKQAATTYTDTSTAASGTVTTAYMNVFGAQTYAATNTTVTVTNLYGTYFTAPVAGTNVTATNSYAVGMDTLRVTGNVLLGGLNCSGGTNFSTAVSSISIGGGSQTTGTIILGGTAGTGTITLGQSTVSQTTSIQAGATASGSTKTINLGTAGLSGSTTAIAIGSAVSGATQTTTINGRVTLAPIGASAAAWTTSGIGLIQSAATFTDTSTAASGTVASAYMNLFAAQTYAATNTTVTVTNLYGTYFTAPVAGTNVTATNRYALAADSLYVAGNIYSNGFTCAGQLTLSGLTTTTTAAFASAATTTGNTKTVSIGTGGLSGSTTAITIGATAGTSTTTLNGSTVATGPLSFGGAGVVVATTTYTVLATDSMLLMNTNASGCTVTLPAASSNTGRILVFKAQYTVGAGNPISSASSNVVPVASATAGTTIIATGATTPRYLAMLQSDGTNWQLISAY